MFDRRISAPPAVDSVMFEYGALQNSEQTEALHSIQFVIEYRYDFGVKKT